MLALALVLCIADAEPLAAHPATSSSSPSDPDRVRSAEHTIGSVQILVADASGKARAEVKSFIGKEITAELTRFPALAVLSFGDLRRMLEVESARQLASCDELSASCMAELRNALGVPWGVFVEVDEVEGLISVGVSLVGSDGSALARETVTLAGLAGVDVRAAFRPALRRLVTPLHQAIGAPLPDEEAKKEPPTLAWITAGSGVVVIVVGAAALGVGLQPVFAHGAAHDQLAALRAESGTDGKKTEAALADAASAQAAQAQAADDWADFGQTVVIVGAVGVTVGAALVGGGLLGLAE